jgi:hypothetical protein
VLVERVLLCKVHDIEPHTSWVEDIGDFEVVPLVVPTCVGVMPHVEIVLVLPYNGDLIEIPRFEVAIEVELGVMERRICAAEVAVVLLLVLPAQVLVGGD